MAYIKGGSVVDGNLYVEGGLVVRNITTSSGAGGQIPTIDDGCANADYLIKFVNENGAIKYSTLKEHIADTTTLSTDANSFKFKLSGKSNENAIVFTTEFKNNKTSLDINSEPTNISVNIPSTKYAIFKNNDNTTYTKVIGTEDTDFNIDKITIDTSSDVPTEFSYSGVLI